MFFGRGRIGFGFGLGIVVEIDFSIRSGGHDRCSCWQARVESEGKSGMFGAQTVSRMSKICEFVILLER